MGSMTEVETWYADFPSNINYSGVMKDGAVYFNGARYRCSEYFWELWKSGVIGPDEPSEDGVHIAVDPVTSAIVIVEICGYSEWCFIDRSRFPLNVERSPNRTPHTFQANEVELPSEEGRQQARQEASAKLVKRPCSGAKALPTVLRTQAGQQYSCAYGMWPRRILRYVGKSNRRRYTTVRTR